MSELHKARHTAEKGADQASKMLDDVKDRASEYINDAREKSQDFFDEAKSRGNDILENVRGRGEDVLFDAKTWVRKNPGTAVACALVAGFVLSSMFRSDD